MWIGEKNKGFNFVGNLRLSKKVVKMRARFAAVGRSAKWSIVVLQVACLLNYYAVTGTTFLLIF